MGWRWDYVDLPHHASVENVDTQLVIGRETVVRRYLVDGAHVLDQYWSVGADGSVFLHGFYQPGFPRTVAYDPPIEYLRAPLHAGDVWEQTFDVYSDLEGLSFVYQDAVFMIVATHDAISVPIGDVDAFGVAETRLERRPESWHGCTVGGLPLPAGTARAQPTTWYTDGLGQVQFLFQATRFRVNDITPGLLPVKRASWGTLKERFAE